MTTEKRARIREFHSGITREFLVLFFANLGMAGVIIVFGMSINQTWTGRGDVFIGIGAIVILCALTLFGKVRGKIIRMTDRTFAFRDGKNESAFMWQEMRTFQVPPANKKFFRSAIVGDSTRNYVIDSLTFPEYELIVSLIAVARRSYRDKAYEIGGT